MNQLRRAYLLHDPELSRVGAAKLIGVARYTVERWENFLSNKSPKLRPSAANVQIMEDRLGLSPTVWEEAAAQWAELADAA